MIGNAVASTLMRLPVAELSALRKVFLASPNGLSLEGFVGAMLPQSLVQNEASGKSKGLKASSASSSRRQLTGRLRRRSSSPAVTPDMRESTAGRRENKSRRKRSASRRKARSCKSGNVADPGRDGAEMSGIGINSPLKQRASKSSGGRKGPEGKGGKGRGTAGRLMWGHRENAADGGDGEGGWSLSEEERIGIVTDLVELFRNVDHNGDQVMEWEEFTGFVIDQVLSLTREAPLVDRLKSRSVCARETPSISRSSVRKVRYDQSLARAFACVGPIVKVWDPTLQHGTSHSIFKGCQQRKTSMTSDSGTTPATIIGRSEEFFAYSPVEEIRGFEIGSSAVTTSLLPPSEGAIMKGRRSNADSSSDSNRSSSSVSGNSRNRGSLHSANPNKNRDGAPVSVVALDVKYIEASKLIMVLRSDLTLCFFLAEETFLRVGLVKTPSQQYVLEHCPTTGIAFTSGCDGSISSFVIETSITAESDQQQQPHVLATATPIGVLRRHTDVVQDLLAVNGTEAEGGPRLISCGLDRRVCVWNSAKGIFAQSKHGNQAAIRSLAFDPRDNLLLGASVEGEVLAWDIWARLGGPLFRMQGHRSPVVSVACASGKGRAASLDESGKMILWDTRRNASVDNSERYLCQLDCSSNRPTSLDVVSNDSAGYLRWSHIGVSVVTTGRYMKIYDVVDPRVPEPPLSVALYSQKCVSFITCNGPFITLWDGCTGKAVRRDRAMEGDVMRACLDGEERRLLLASSLGEIVIYRFLQGTRIRTMSPEHDGPVSGMVYVKEDKLIVTGGWDLSLRVYDEAPREGDPPLLRQVEGAHSSDINVISVSHRLGLIASGSAEGGCRLWDYQFLSCEGSYDVGSEVLCVIFLEPHPLVAAGDAGGHVSIIPVRPWSQVPGEIGTAIAGNASCSSPLLRFTNDPEAEGSIEGPASVTCLTHRGGGGIEGMVLYSGDDKGTVRAWDMEDILALAGCHEAPAEERLPRSQKYYDPRRRFNKQAGSTPQLPQHHAEPKAARGVEIDGCDGALRDRRSHKLSTPSLTVTTDAVEGMGMRFGMLQDPDGTTAQEQHHHKPAGCQSRMLMGESSQTDTIIHGAPLIGIWTPHSEAVISLEVIQDPPCLLTGSRDRSVKLRALPIQAQQRSDTGQIPQNPAETSSSKKPDQEAQAEKGSLIKHRGESNDDVLAGPTPPTTPLHPGHASVEARQQQQQQQQRQQQQLPDGVDGRPIVDRDELLSSRHSPASPSLASAAAVASAMRTPTSPSSKSSKSTTSSSTSAKIPQHGEDLSTLTLGRIDDSFRRDIYKFPVDLQGRGEGRAVEARAVLQAIEEIEIRKEKRKKEEAALDRARVEAAAAAASGSSPHAVQSLSTSSRAGDPPAVSTAEGHSPDAADATSAEPLYGKAIPPVDRWIPVITASSEAAGSDGTGGRGNSAASSLPNTTPLCGPETNASTSRRAKQSTIVSSSRGGEAENNNEDVIKGVAGSTCDGGMNNSIGKKGHAMYENMAIEELRVKSLEAGSKAAVRGAREAVAIRELLEPTPFLLSQMPDVLSSYPAIKTFLSKHGVAVSHGQRALGNHPQARGDDQLAWQNSEAIVSGASTSSSASSLSPVRALKKRREKRPPSSLPLPGSADASLQLSGSVGGSLASCSSFDRVAGQQQPSLLDYSPQGIGLRAVTRACVPGQTMPNEGEQRPLGAGQGVETRPTERTVMEGVAPTPNVSGTEAARGEESQLIGVQPDGRLTTLISVQADKKHDRLHISEALGQRGGVDTSKRPQPQGEGEERGRGVRYDPGKGRQAEGREKPRGMLAKVKTHRPPRRKLPGYLSASPNSFGAASRWGAMSKAHLEFHRLDTAGLLSSLSCPSLRCLPRGIAPSSSVPNDAEGWYDHLEHFRQALLAGRTAKDGTPTGNGAKCSRRRQGGFRGYETQNPLELADLDDMARKYARAQAHWKRRLNAFVADEINNTMPQSTSLASNSGRLKLRRLAMRKSQDRKRGEPAVRIGKRTVGWRLAEPATSMKGQQEQAEPNVDREIGRDGTKKGEDILRAKTHFGPYNRSELFALWSAFGRAKAFGSKVDAGLLLKDPCMREDTRYRKVLMEVLSTSKAGRTGPVLLAREDALLKLLPRLERSEAGMFVAAAKLAEADAERQGVERTGTVKFSNDIKSASEGTGVEVDPRTLQELHVLFDLYDVDRSGFVDVKEIVAALKGNYSTVQISAGTADAVTEGELADLLSSLETATATTVATITEDSGTFNAENDSTIGKELEARKAIPELDFYGFVRLFQGVF